MTAMPSNHPIIFKLGLVYSGSGSLDWSVPVVARGTIRFFKNISDTITCILHEAGWGIKQFMVGSLALRVPLFTCILSLVLLLRWQEKKFFLNGPTGHAVRYIQNVLTNR